MRRPLLEVLPLPLFPLLLVACGGQGGPTVLDTADLAADRGPARLHCEEPSFDFGRIWEGTVIEHDFELEVRGAAPLAVQAATGSCGCTVSTLTHADGRPYVMGTPLTPGERLELAVRFTSQGRQGPQQRAVSIIASDGRSQVELVGDVAAYLTPEREVLALGELLPSAESIATVRLTTADGAPTRLAVQTLPPLPEDLHAELMTADGDREGPASEWILAVRALAGGRLGAFDYPVRVDTLDAQGQATDVGATVFVAWSRVQPLDARPPLFRLPSLTVGEPASGRVQLEVNVAGLDVEALDLDGARFELEGPAAAIADRLDLRTWSEEGRSGLELFVPGLPEGLGPRLVGRVLLPVDHPDQAELEIRVDTPIRTRP